MRIFPHLLKIYGVSALSLNKKQSSTYKKYACGCFLYAPSIYTVYFKRLTANGISERAGCPWFYAATSLPANLQPKNVHGCIFLGEDGGGSTQKRVRLRTRSPKIDKEVNFWARISGVQVPESWAKASHCSVSAAAVSCKT